MAQLADIASAAAILVPASSTESGNDEVGDERYYHRNIRGELVLDVARLPREIILTIQGKRCVKTADLASNKSIKKNLEDLGPWL